MFSSLCGNHRWIYRWFSRFNGPFFGGDFRNVSLPRRSRSRGSNNGRSPRYPNRSIQRAVSPSPWSFLAIDGSWTWEHHNFSMLQNIVGLMVVRHIIDGTNIIHVISCDFMNYSNMSLTSWARPNSFKFHVCWTWINCWKLLKYSKMNWCLGCPNSNTM